MSADQNAAHLLRESSQSAGHRTAILERLSALSYRDLWKRATAIAAALVAGGVGPDEPVAIFLERGTESAAAFFATLAVGAIAVFVNSNLRPRQIQFILTHSGARALLTTSELLGRQPRPVETSASLIDLDALDHAPAADFPVRPRGENDAAQIIYTSGSSGPPKGVVVSHGNLRAAASTVVGYLGITPADRIASLLPFSFVYGMSQLLCSVSTAATLVVERSPLIQEIVATVRTREVTVLAAVPTLWRQLLEAPGFRHATLPHLRVLTNAGGHLPKDAVRGLRQAQPHAGLFLMYGCTETMRSTYLAPSEVDRRPDSIGRAIPGAEVDVVLEDGSPAPPGEVGELVHSGPTVTLGYWRDEERTERVYRPHPWRPGERVVYTGDLVRRDAAGFLYYVGRKDFVIKTMGYRVGPDEVADVLFASGEVQEAVVFGEPDPSRGERIVACVVLRSTDGLERLRQFCSRELPRHLQPGRFDVRDRLPILPNGKPDYEALRVA